MSIREDLRKTAKEVREHGLASSKKETGMFEKVASTRIAIVTSFLNSIK